MFGLILATCVTVTSHCNEPSSIKYDIIEATETMQECKVALMHEPAWRQKLLVCDEITPVDENGNDIPANKQ